MSLNSKKVGDLGEKIAVEYLQRKGYDILDRNYFIKEKLGPRIGEVDIIARRGKGIIDILKRKENSSIHFIEVKALLDSDRQRIYGFLPEDKVNFQKQKKLVMTAQSWLLKNKITLDTKWQIDVISVRINPKRKKAKIRYFPNAVSL